MSASMIANATTDLTGRPMTAITIYHNPRCGTSRNALALLRERGLDPQVIEYLNDPPDETRLRGLLADMGITARELLRAKEPLCEALGLRDPSVDDEALVAAMLAHPILINRPVVVTPHGTRLCRPSETVLELLDAAG